MSTDEELFIQKYFGRTRPTLPGNIQAQESDPGLRKLRIGKKFYKKEILEKNAEIAKLLDRIEWFKRKVWGKSSESFIVSDPQQRVLDFDGLDVLPQEMELATCAQEQIEEYRTKRVAEKIKEAPVRKPLPESLPRMEIHLYPEGMDKDNIDSAIWAELEPEVTEVLEREPAKFFVNRFIRHKFVRKDKSIDVQKPIVIASVPVLPIAKSYAGATLLADLVIDKYVNHLPFYRQIQIFSRQGISIAPPRSTTGSAACRIF